MEKRNWLWKRKSSDKSPGETESSESISSLSERNYDDQEAQKVSPNPEIRSPITSIAESNGEEVQDRFKNLTEKLSAALVNVSAKDDLVTQHSKVAEEAVAGWEKAENEAVALKQQLEASFKNNSALEDRLSHLDGALKECVRQLRQAREEQEQKIQEAVKKKSQEWEATKSELETMFLELQARASKDESPAIVDPEICSKLDFLESENMSLKLELATKSEFDTQFLELQAKERENSALKLELFSLFEELEYRTIERDLSTQAAETASKQLLESIKKMAKLEAECRRLKSMPHKSSSDHIKSVADSQSDGGDRFNELISEFDQFENKKNVKNITVLKGEIDLMDDFLEMERLAALPQTGIKTSCLATQVIDNQSVSEESSLRAELEAMHNHTIELEEKLGKMEAKQVQLEEKLEILEAEKAELEEKLEIMEVEKDDFEINFKQMEAGKEELEEKLEKMEAEKDEFEENIHQMETEKAELVKNLTESRNCIKLLRVQLKETEIKFSKMQKELQITNEMKSNFETQLVGIEVEARTMRVKIDSLKADVEKERAFSAEIAIKNQELEDELSRKKQEEETASSNGELKIKQEDLVVAAGKFAECQQTIASLGKQLKSLAMLEDFLIDTTNLTDLSESNGEVWRLHSNDSLNVVSSEKSQKCFVKMFSRNNNGCIQLEN